MLANAVLVDALGYLSAAFVFLTFTMKTMLRLRVIAILSNLAFVSYALVADLMPILVLHGLLLPLNIGRLVEMRRHVRQAEATARAGRDGESFLWLLPHGRTRRLPAGDALFRKGDAAESLFVIAEGRIRLPELGIVLGPGEILGEMSLFSGDRRRTVSAEALDEVRLAELSEARVREIYFDNPAFAYALIRIITRRLVDNMRQLEQG